MSPTDERESVGESVGTLPARRPANYTDVYTAWNKGGRVDVYELEDAFTRRLKRSLDALRKRRSQPDSHLDDSDEHSTGPCSSRPREGSSFCEVRELCWSSEMVIDQSSYGAREREPKMSSEKRASEIVPSLARAPKSELQRLPNQALPAPAPPGPA
ncbi:hypothetical protein SprV_0301092100 [Sparganum proliferum]